MGRCLEGAGEQEGGGDADDGGQVVGRGGGDALGDGADRGAMGHNQGGMGGGQVHRGAGQGGRGPGQRGRGGGQGARGRGRGGGRVGGRGGGRRVRARAWAFTMNNYYASIDPHAPLPALQPNMQYLCYGREVCPTTGTPHLQGYVVFNYPVQNPNRLFAEYGPHTHMERALGSAEENAEYCAKEGDFLEYGDIPVSAQVRGERGGGAEQERWKAAFLSAKEGKLDEIPEDIRTRFYSTYEKIKRDYAPKPSHLDGPLQHLWIVGGTGTGKSSWAFRYRVHCAVYRL